MSQLICGRCGHLTASHSTYCPYDKWTLWKDAPEGDPRVANELATLQLPRGMSGFLSRRRDEGHRSQIEKSIRQVLDARLSTLETRATNNPTDWEAQRELGLLAILDDNWERANAHFERARELYPNDLQTLINHAVVLAHRSKWSPAIDTLNAARALSPQNSQVLFNLALCAVGARRPEIALEAVEALESEWKISPELAYEYHDDALSARGMALLQLERPHEARRAFEAAARHTSQEPDSPSTASTAALVETSPGPPEGVTGAENTGENSVESESASQQYEAGENAAEAQLATEGGASNADLLINLALVEAQTGDISRAIGRLSVALRMEPGHPRALNNLGVLSYRQNAIGAALRFLELARQMEEVEGSVSPQMLSHLGVALSANGQLAEGLEMLARAGSHEAAETEVFYNTGRAFIEHGKPERGVEFLRQAFASNPNQPDVHVVLGAAYLLRGRPELLTQAMQHLRRALQLDPLHRIALANVTMGFRDGGQADQARKALETALKAHPRGPELLFLIGLTVMDVGDEQHWAQAAKAFEGARQYAGDMPAAQYNSALCQYLMGFRDSAAKLLEGVTLADPAFAPAYYLIGVGHAAGKRFNEALAAWKIAEKYEPGNPDLQANIGFIYYRRGEYPNAIKHFLAAHHAAPRESILLTALGLTYARSSIERGLEKAIDYFNRALEIDDTLPVTHMNLGLAYYIRKRPDLSVPHWRRVSQLDIDYYKRIEEQEMATGKRSYDDSFIQMRPLNWRARVVGLSPVLPRPHTELLPGDNLRAFRLAIADPELQRVREMNREMKHLDRILAWASVK